MVDLNFKEYSLSGNDEDTGSPESQILVFTRRINCLARHTNENKHDNTAKLSLRKTVDKRRKMLKYLKKKSLERYNKMFTLIKNKQIE